MQVYTNRVKWEPTMGMTIRSGKHTKGNELTLLDDCKNLVAYSQNSVSKLTNWEQIINNQDETMYLFDKSYSESSNTYKYRISDSSQTLVKLYKTSVNGKYKVYAKGLSIPFEIKHNLDCSRFSLYSNNSLVAVVDTNDNFLYNELEINIVDSREIQLTYAVALVLARLLIDKSKNLLLYSN